MNGDDNQNGNNSKSNQAKNGLPIVRVKTYYEPI